MDHSVVTALEVTTCKSKRGSAKSIMIKSVLSIECMVNSTVTWTVVLFQCNGLRLIPHIIENLHIHLFEWLASELKRMTILNLSISVKLPFFIIITFNPCLYLLGTKPPNRGISDL